MRKLCFGLGAFLVLLVGLLISPFVWAVLHHHYNSPEIGYYRGSLRGYVRSGDLSVGLIGFKGESDARWYFRSPTNFAYKTLVLDTRRIQATVKLDRNTIELNGTEFEFSEESLQKAIFGDSVTSEQLDLIRGLREFFVSAYSGDVPGPRHHTYSIDSPIDVTFTHFHLGFGIGWTAFAWVFVWLCGVVFFGRNYFAKGSVTSAAPA